MSIISELILTTSTVIFGASLGIYLHETSHYLVGWAAGGSPFVRNWWLIFPVTIDFKTPSEMIRIGIRITGGIVVLYPTFTTILVGLNWENYSSYDQFLIGFFSGASVVSWLDLLALFEPEKWRRYTTGEPISRPDSKQQTNE